MRKIIVRHITFTPGFVVGLGHPDRREIACKVLSSTPNQTRIGLYVDRLSGWYFSYYA